jgi:hypothetical protein
MFQQQTSKHQRSRLARSLQIAPSSHRPSMAHMHHTESVLSYLRQMKVHGRNAILARRRQIAPIRSGGPLVQATPNRPATAVQLKRAERCRGTSTAQTMSPRHGAKMGVLSESTLSRAYRSWTVHAVNKITLAVAAAAAVCGYSQQQVSCKLLAGGH